MRSRSGSTSLGCALVVGVVALLAPAAALGNKIQLKQISVTNGGADSQGLVRTPDGALHLVFQTSVPPGGDDHMGVGSVSISPSGSVGPDVQALSNWDVTNQPGLVALPGGTLEAVFGGGSQSTNGYEGPFGLISNDGGATWSAPVDIGSHQNEPSTGHVTGVVSGGTPFLTVGCCGVLEIQQGFGPGAPTTPVATAGETAEVDSAVDAASGEVVVGYQGNNVDSYMQGVAPGAAQSAQALPHPKSPKPWLVVAGRDSGPGVFAAYSTDDNHVRLARYGTSATVPVGAVPGHIPNSLGVATGIGGRIWVMWGDTASNPQIEITRSNKAVTKFEPIQHLNSNAFDLWHIFGDGRLGPLDLVVNEAPVVPLGQQLVDGNFYARVLPMLSASVAVKKLGGGKFKLKVKVTDAGDAVSGAKASAKGKHGTTNGSGVTKFTVSGSSGSHATVTIKASGYRTLKKKVKL